MNCGAHPEWLVPAHIADWLLLRIADGGVHLCSAAECLENFICSFSPHLRSTQNALITSPPSPLPSPPSKQQQRYIIKINNNNNTTTTDTKYTKPPPLLARKQFVKVPTDELRDSERERERVEEREREFFLKRKV